MGLADLIEHTPDGFRINGSITIKGNLSVTEASVTPGCSTWSAVTGDGKPEGAPPSSEQSKRIAAVVETFGNPSSTTEDGDETLGHFCNSDDSRINSFKGFRGSVGKLRPVILKYLSGCLKIGFVDDAFGSQLFEQRGDNQNVSKLSVGHSNSPSSVCVNTTIADRGGAASLSTEGGVA